MNARVIVEERQIQEGRTPQGAYTHTGPTPGFTHRGPTPTQRGGPRRGTHHRRGGNIYEELQNKRASRGSSPSLKRCSGRLGWVVVCANFNMKRNEIYNARNYKTTTQTRVKGEPDVGSTLGKKETPNTNEAAWTRARLSRTAPSRASVLETLPTAQTRLVLQTATYRRQKRSTQTEDRREARRLTRTHRRHETHYFVDDLLLGLCLLDQVGVGPAPISSFYEFF